MENQLSQQEIDLLPTKTLAELLDKQTTNPNGLIYDSSGLCIGKKPDFNFDPNAKYPLRIEPMPDFSDEEDDSLDEKEQNQTDRLINLILDSPAKLFHDTFGNAMIAINGDGGKVLKIRSKDFKTWLANIWWKKYQKGIGGQIIETAARTLEGQAIHEGEQIKMNTRIAHIGGKWFYDLGNGRVVEITDEGWKVIDQPPILFYRYSHQQPQSLPQTGWDIKEIFNYLPCPQDENERILLMLWLIAAYIPDFYKPLILVHGEQGSRKTTLFKLLRSLIDPSVLETITLRNDLAEFIQQASHNYFLPLDNLTNIRPDISDLLCRLITGEGFSKRELFSDDSDIIYSFHRVVGLNGINLAADKADLLDRSIILKLTPPDKYEDENLLFKKFNEAKPKLLGAIFDILVKTKQELLKNTEIEGLAEYRMAGFARHALAIGRVLSFTDEQVLAALKYNRQRQHTHVLDSSVLLQVLIKFMESSPSWEGTPTKLFNEIKSTAEANNIDTKNKAFPQSSSWLKRRINEILPTLRAQGIEFNEARGKDRLITLTSKNAVVADNTDEKSFSLEEIGAGLPFEFPENDSNVDNDSIL